MDRIAAVADSGRVTREGRGSLGLSRGAAGTKRKSAMIVGVLYIIGTVTGVLSLVLVTPILDVSEFLIRIGENPNQMIAGALLVLIMGLALAMVSVVMFPILRKQNEILAVGYVVFRGGIETVTYLAGVVSWLFLVVLSQEYARAGAPNAPYYQTLGTLLRDGHDAIDPIVSIVFCLGALMFYFLLYQSGLVPRWLSGWGLIAAMIYLASGLLEMFQLIGPMAMITGALRIPLGLQEMVLAVWLIIRGFDPSAIASLFAETDPIRPSARSTSQDGAIGC